MSKFQVGDEVRRIEEYRDAIWDKCCEQADMQAGAALTVGKVDQQSLWIEEFKDHYTTPWSVDFFEPAWPTPEPAPDHGDSPSYDLLATISRLESSVEQYREWVAGLESDLDTRSQQLDVAMRRNNTLTDQLDDLRAQLDFSGTLVQESDAAGAAAEADLAAAKAHAKQLAADLEYSRHSWRLAQYHLTQVQAVLGGVSCTLHTVNLGELASQLRGVAAGLESIDNGADAALVRRAGNLLDLFNMAIVDGKRQ